MIFYTLDFAHVPRVGDPMMMGAILEEEEYINVRPALRVLMRLDDRVRMAVELLEKGETRDAVYLLREARLEQDQIIYIISSVLRIPVEEAENIYIKETTNRVIP